MEGMLVPLDFSNVDGETAEQFVERNRKAIVVEMFRRAMSGDKMCLDAALKIVSAPFIQKSKVLALNGNAVAFEGIAGAPGLDKLLDNLRRGEIKTDAFAIPRGAEKPKVKDIVAHEAIHSGEHEVAVIDREKRINAFVRGRGLREFIPPAPEMLVRGDGDE